MVVIAADNSLFKPLLIRRENSTSDTGWLLSVMRPTTRRACMRFVPSELLTDAADGCKSGRAHQQDATTGNKQGLHRAVPARRAWAATGTARVPRPRASATVASDSDAAFLVVRPEAVAGVVKRAQHRVYAWAHARVCETVARRVLRNCVFLIKCHFNINI
jgi:hypothetical protein